MWFLTIKRAVFALCLCICLTLPFVQAQEEPQTPVISLKSDLADGIVVPSQIFRLTLGLAHMPSVPEEGTTLHIQIHYNTACFDWKALGDSQDIPVQTGDAGTLILHLTPPAGQASDIATLDFQCKQDAPTGQAVQFLLEGTLMSPLNPSPLSMTGVGLTLNLTEPFTPDVCLKSLMVNNAVLSPEFSKDQTEYVAQAQAPSKEVNLDYEAFSDSAIVEVSQTSLSDTQQIVKIKVSSAQKEESKTYTITVNTTPMPASQAESSRPAQTASAISTTSQRRNQSASSVSRPPPPPASQIPTGGAASPSPSWPLLLGGGGLLLLLGCLLWALYKRRQWRQNNESSD